MSDSDRNKRVIGIYGEMRLAMELHTRGWQVYRAYIDDKFDFVILKSYCTTCQDYRNAWTREQPYKGRIRKTVTQLCEFCNSDSLIMLVRFIQVKTSEGINRKERNGIETAHFDFHAKIRYHLADGRVFYVWIQVWDRDTHDVNYYIFQTEDVARFDDLNLTAYQITDNQKNRLTIDRSGVVHNQGIKYDFSAFEEFRDNFACLEERFDEEKWI